MTTYREDWAQRPAVRLVHVRRDSEGRWFWYHHRCRRALSGIGDWRDAVAQADQHARHDVRDPYTGLCTASDVRPGTPFLDHIEADPDANTLRASWLCPDCRQYCASHNPCDCCWDEE